MYTALGTGVEDQCDAHPHGALLMGEMIEFHTLAMATDMTTKERGMVMGRILTGSSRLASDIRKMSFRAVMTELLSEGVGEVNWGQTETTSCAKALGWAGKPVTFEWLKKGSAGGRDQEQV